MKIAETGAWQNEDGEGHSHDDGLAKALSIFLRKASAIKVLDMGCGTGGYVRQLRKDFFQADGVDGNPNTAALTDGLGSTQDFTEPFDKGKYDWVLSIEIGEHIPADKLDMYWDNLDKHARHGIVISWATPGQGGDGHISEKPWSYLSENMNKRGFLLDLEHTNWLRGQSGLHWLKRNVAVFYRKEPQYEEFEPLTPKDLRLCLMTCPREPQYIHTTLANLFMSGKSVFELGAIDIFVDSKDLSMMDNYKHFTSVNIIGLTQEEDAFLNSVLVEGKMRTCQRFCHNYFKCMDVDMAAYRGLIVVEDDILIADGFVDKALQAVNEVMERRKSFVMCLCGLNRFKALGTYSAQYPATTFHGTQATFFSPELIPHLKKEMWDKGVLEALKPGDLLIHDAVYAWQNIYNSVIDIADHVGDVSTGLGGRPRSKTFHDPWPKEKQ